MPAMLDPAGSMWRQGRQGGVQALFTLIDPSGLAQKCQHRIINPGLPWPAEQIDRFNPDDDSPDSPEPIEDRLVTSYDF